MINLTDLFLETAPSRYRIPFGINKNVLLKGVNNDPRRDKNGVLINKNCFMTFSVVDPDNDNKILSERVFDSFNLDKPDYASLNFRHQMVQLMEILKAVVPAKSFGKAKNAFNSAMLTNKEDLQEILALGKEGKPGSALLKKMKTEQQNMVNSFIKVISPFVGSKGDLLQLSVVTGRTGKFFEFPREEKGFIAKMDGAAIRTDLKYVRWYEDRNKVETASGDDIGGDDSVLEEEELLLDDAQGLDDI